MKYKHKIANITCKQFWYCFPCLTTHFCLLLSPTVNSTLLGTESPQDVLKHFSCDSPKPVNSSVTCRVTLNILSTNVTLAVDFDDGHQVVEVVIEQATPNASRELSYEHVYTQEGWYHVTVTADMLMEASYGVYITKNLCNLPVVTIDLLSSNSSYPTSIKRSHSLSVTAMLDLLCTEDIRLAFDWLIQHQVTETVFEEVDLNAISTKQTKLIVPSHTLSYGAHKVLFRVEMIGPDTGNVIGRKLTESWIDVKPSDLEASIDGGSKRSVGRMSEVIFDGSASADPDEDDPHVGLVFMWYCIVKEHPDDQSGGMSCDGSGISSSAVLTLPALSLIESASYNFFLNISKEGRKTVQASQEIIVFLGNPPQIQIKCLSNCGSYLSSDTKLILQAHCSSCDSADVSYIWVLEKDGRQLTRFGWSTQTTTGRYQEYLVLTPQAVGDFRVGSYIISVSGATADGDGLAQHNFNINAPPGIGTCSIQPKEGTALGTGFVVTCKDFTDPYEQLTYTIFKKEISDNSLISLHTSHSTVSPPLYLPVGERSDDYMITLHVEVSDSHRGTAVDVNVRVIPPVIPASSSLEDMMLNMTLSPDSVLQNLLLVGNTESANQMMGSIASTLNSQSDVGEDQGLAVRAQIRGLLVGMLSEILIQSMDDLEQISSTLMQVTGSRNELTSGAQVSAINTISDMAVFLKKQCTTSEDGNSRQSDSAVTLLLNGMSNILEAAADMSPEGPKDIDSTIQSEYRSIVLMLLVSMETLQDALLCSKVPGETPTQIETASFGISTSKQKSLSGTSVIASPNANAKFRLSISHVMPGNQSAVIAMQVVEFKTNPFSWAAGKKSISSIVMGLKLKKEDTEIKVAEMKGNIDIFLPTSSSQMPSPVTFELMKGSVLGFTLNVSSFTMDQSEALMLTILPSALNVDIVVCVANVSGNSSDDCWTNVTLPDRSKPFDSSLEANYTWMVPQDALFADSLVLNIYCGEVPSPELWAESQLKLTVYSAAVQCTFWDEDTEKWDGHGCAPGQLTTPWTTHCLCNHLTFFGSSLLVKPNKIVLITDARLFLTFTDNPLVVCTVVVVFALYLVVAIWAHRKDKQDVLRAQVTVLEDNDPYAHHRYAITIVTGMRPGAGTTATVTLTLHGSHGNSEPHILTGASHPILTRGSQDCILLTTREALGEVTGIRVWHDNAGHSPDWYISHFTVHDIETDATFIFICKSWLASTMGEGKIDQLFHTANAEQLQAFGNLFSSITTLDFQDGHLWLSVLSRPARSPFTRLQRVSCCFSLLMTAMMTNIMFYGVPVSPHEQVLDFGALRITIKEIIIGIESSTIAFPINMLIVSIFRHANASHLDSKHKYEILQKMKQRMMAAMSVSSTSSPLKSKPMCRDDSRTFTDLDEIESDSSLNGTNRKGRVRKKNLSEKENLKVEVLASRMDDSKERGNDNEAALSSAGDEKERNVSDAPATSEKTYNLILFSLLSTLADDVQNLPSNRFMSKEEHKKACDVAKALVLTAMSIRTPSSSSYDTSTDSGMENAVDSDEDTWISWLRRKPQKNLDKSFKLPHWFIYIAWLLLFVTCLVSAYVTMLYGLKYGKQRSLDWLVALFVSTFQSIFISQPLKLILLAVFLSMTFRKWDMGDDVAEGIEEFEVANAEQIHEKLVQKKIHDQRYQPPPLASVDHHRFCKQQEKKMYALLQEILGYLLFIWLLVLITYSRRDRYAFYLTNDIKNRYFEGNKIYRKNLTHFLGFFQWTESTLIPNLYGDDTEADTQSILLGSVRFRQLRVRHDSCTIPKVIGPTMLECWAQYSRKSEENRSFNNSWSQLVSFQPLNESAWRFQPHLTIPFRGKITIYKQGGFVWYLGKTKEEAVMSVLNLKETRWLDEHTRALFVDWAVYNANTNMFGVVTLLLESPAGGGMLKYYQIQSVRLYRSVGNYAIFVTICECAFVLSVFYYSFREVKQWLELRGTYWRDYWNWLEVAIIASSFLIIALYTTQMIFIGKFLQEYQQKQCAYFDFRPAASMEDRFTLANALLVILSTIKFLHLLRLNPRMYLLTTVLGKSSPELCGFSLMLFLLITTFAVFLTLHLGSQLAEYRNFIASFVTLFNALPGNFDVDGVKVISRSIGSWIVFIYQFIGFFILLNLFVSALNDTMISVRKRPRVSADYVMGLILISKILSWFGIRKKVKINLEDIIMEEKKRI